MERYPSVKERILLDYHFFLFGIHEWVSDKPSSLMRQVGNWSTSRKCGFLSSRIRKGIADGEIAAKHDPERTADLLVHVLFGLWVVWCKWQAAGYELQSTDNIKEFMSRKAGAFTIFFNGLK